MNSKERMKELHLIYENKYSKSSFARDMLDGELNRIAITDDENELNRLLSIVHDNLDNYIKLARESNKAFNDYKEVFEQYRKEQHK